MSTRMSRLLVGAAVAPAVLVLAQPAYADCAERIAAVEKHPAIAEAGSSGDTKSPQRPSASEESGSQDEGGEVVREDGGKTVYQGGGPATPTESWFTGEEEPSAALTYLDAARKARGQGDEKACLEAVEQAEAAIRANSG